MECVSRVTRSALAVEMDTKYCPAVEKRANESNGRFQFACVRFPNPLVPPADVYFAWVPDRYNMAIVAGFLQGLQARTVPSGATLVLGFAHAMKQELDCWRVLQPYATGQHTLWFNEGKRKRESGYYTLGLWSTLEPDMLRQLHQADTNADCPCSTRKIWGGCAEDVAKATKEGRQPGGSRTALERGAKGKAATHVNDSTLDRLTFLYDPKEGYHLRPFGYSAALNRLSPAGLSHIQLAKADQLLKHSARLQPAQVCVCQKRGCLNLTFNEPLARARCAHFVLDPEDAFELLKNPKQSLGRYLRNERLLGILAASCEAKRAFAVAGFAAAVVPHHHTNLDVIASDAHAAQLADDLTRAPPRSLGFLGMGKRLDLAELRSTKVTSRGNLLRSIACSAGLELHSIVQRGWNHKPPQSTSVHVARCQNETICQRKESDRGGTPTCSRRAKHQPAIDTFEVVNFPRFSAGAPLREALGDQARWALDPALSAISIAVLWPVHSQSTFVGVHSDPQKLLTWWARGVPTVTWAGYQSHADAMLVAEYRLPDGRFPRANDPSTLRQLVLTLARSRRARAKLAQNGLLAARRYNVQSIARLLYRQVRNLLNKSRGFSADYGEGEKGFRHGCLTELNASLLR